MITINHEDRRTSTRFWRFAENRSYMKNTLPFQKANLLSVCVLILVMLFDHAHLALAAVINQQPHSTNVLAGSNATFTVVADGTAPLCYRWSFNGTNLANGGRISGATSSNLLITAVIAGDAGNYQVVVSNSISSMTSAVATLTVWLPPSITNQPASQVTLFGSTVAFSVGASGSEPLVYRWRKNSQPLADDAHIAGTTNTTLTISGIQMSDAGRYDVASAICTVLPPARQQI